MRMYKTLVDRYLDDKFHVIFAGLHLYAMIMAGVAIILHGLAVAYHLEKYLHRGLDK